MPEIDLLIISTITTTISTTLIIKALMPKVKRVVTPLGVGSHLRHWEWMRRLLMKWTEPDDNQR